MIDQQQHLEPVLDFAVNEKNGFLLGKLMPYKTAEVNRAISEIITMQYENDRYGTTQMIQDLLANNIHFEVPRELVRNLDKYLWSSNAKEKVITMFIQQEQTLHLIL